MITWSTPGNPTGVKGSSMGLRSMAPPSRTGRPMTRKNFGPLPSREHSWATAWKSSKHPVGLEGARSTSLHIEEPETIKDVCWMLHKIFFTRCQWCPMFRVWPSSFASVATAEKHLVRSNWCGCHLRSPWLRLKSWDSKVRKKLSCHPLRQIQTLLR